MRGPIVWKFILVTTPMEHIRVVRPGLKKYHINGVKQKGFSALLHIGDRVYFKVPHQYWRKKFSLVIRPGRNYQAIHYGRQYGPYPNQYRALKELPDSAFENAGLIV